MPFVKGNTIGKQTRFKTGQSGNPAGYPPDKWRRFIYAELDKVERDATGKHDAVTKLQVLAERIVDDAIARMHREPEDVGRAPLPDAQPPRDRGGRRRCTAG